jgi:hypothetical protein
MPIYLFDDYIEDYMRCFLNNLDPSIYDYETAKLILVIKVGNRI